MRLPKLWVGSLFGERATTYKQGRVVCALLSVGRQVICEDMSHTS